MQLLKRRRTSKAVYVPSPGIAVIQQPAQVVVRPDGSIVCNGRPEECQRLLIQLRLPLQQRAVVI